MKYRQTISRWGNSSGIRLPRQVMEAAGLFVEQQVEIEVKNGAVLLTPASPPESALADLLQGVTPDQISGEIEWGQALGGERYE